MMRRLSPNEQRFAAFCALRRPLTPEEEAEAWRLKRAICNARCQRQRYRRDAEYREKIKRQNLQRYHEARA
jgi:hypothetical protein